MPLLQLDPTALLLLVLAIVLGAFVRGFAGFGAALIFMPLASTVIEPRLAVAMIWVFDAPSAAFLVYRVRHLVRWREIALLAAGAALGLPIGATLLVRLDDTLLRWLICASILVATGLLASNWRWRGPTGRATTLATGLVSGLFGGSTSLAGPPVVLFWLGQHGEAALARAGIVGFFAAMTVMSGITFTLSGILDRETIAAGLPLMPLYLVAIWLGARLFARRPSRHYRTVAFTICALAALAGLPLWSR